MEFFRKLAATFADEPEPEPESEPVEEEGAVRWMNEDPTIPANPLDFIEQSTNRFSGLIFTQFSDYVHIPSPRPTSANIHIHTFDEMSRKKRSDDPEEYSKITLGAHARFILLMYSSRVDLDHFKIYLLTDDDRIRIDANHINVNRDEDVETPNTYYEYVISVPTTLYELLQLAKSSKVEYQIKSDGLESEHVLSETFHQKLIPALLTKAFGPDYEPLIEAYEAARKLRAASSECSSCGCGH